MEKPKPEDPSYGTFSVHDELKTTGVAPLRQVERGAWETILLAFLGSLTLVGAVTGFAYVVVMVFLV